MTARDRIWFWSWIIPCGAVTLFIGSRLVNIQIADVIAGGMLLLIMMLSITLVFKSYRDERIFVERYEEYEAIFALREIGWDDVAWLKDVDSDCVVYENQQYDHMEEYYVKFFNKTDEVLFNIARGQER